MLPNNSSIYRFFKLSLVLLAFSAPLQYLAAQSFQQDSATIRELVISASKVNFSDSATAIRKLNEALVLAQKHNDKVFAYLCYSGLSYVYRNYAIPDKSLSHLERAAEFESALPDSLKNQLYYHSSWANMVLNRYEKAYEWTHKLEQLGISAKNESAKQWSLSQFGVLYTEINEFDKAAQYFCKAIESSLKRDIPIEICEDYRMLAKLYIKAKNFDLALKASEDAVKYVDKIANDDFMRYRIYINHGVVLKECKQYDKAIAAYTKAESIGKSIKNAPILVRAYVGLMSIYTLKGDYEKAEFYARLCPKIEQISTSDMPSYQNTLGNLYIKQKKYADAINILKQGIALCEKNKKIDILQNNYALIAEAYANSNKEGLAYTNLQKSVAIQDSVFSLENTKRIAEVQFKYNLTKSEEEVKTVKMRQVYFFIAAVFVLLVLLLAFLMYFSKNKNENNKILLEKNQEIKDKNRQLEESNEVLRQFAYASAHDLKEPLRSINSFVNILQKKYLKLLPSEAHEYMGFVTTGVARMEKLLNALLEYSTVLVNDNTGDNPNNIPDILRPIFDQFQNLINEKQASIYYAAVFPKIVMNEAHLRQLLANLTHNALKFSKDIALINIGYIEQDNDIVIFVKDKGIGMDKSYSNKVFKLFQRLDRITHEESVGIGLTICKNIVDKYSGRIWFESALGEGTTFYIAFPKTMISEMPATNTPPQYLEIKGEILEEMIYKNNN
jgi:signal transduction histidine kinase